MSDSIPRWKYWLSYLYDIHIESRESEINDFLNLVLSKGRLQLYTENAIYSFEDLYDNFFSTFKQFNFDLLPKEAEVLILGYGMGSIPVMLEKKFHRKYNFTGIELDEEIIDLANRYIIPKLSSPHQIIFGDAQNFIQITEEKYDLIIIDLFINDIIPTQFEKKPFLELLPDRLNENGVILFNRLANDSFTKKQAKIFLSEIFKPIFNKADRLIIDDNWIIFSDKRFIH